MIHDQWFLDLLDCTYSEAVEQQCMAAEPRRQAGDRGWRTTERTGDLAMSRAGVKTSCDEGENARMFGVIGTSESLLREGSQAYLALEASHAATVAESRVETASFVAKAACDVVLRAAGPGAMGRVESHVRDLLDWSSRPLHD
jgi:hypothetical protein